MDEYNIDLTELLKELGASSKQIKKILSDVDEILKKIDPIVDKKNILTVIFVNAYLSLGIIENMMEKLKPSTPKEINYFIALMTHILLTPLQTILADLGFNSHIIVEDNDFKKNEKKTKKHNYIT